jgi:hypothetical protein
MIGERASERRASKREEGERARREKRISIFYYSNST